MLSLAVCLISMASKSTTSTNCDHAILLVSPTASFLCLTRKWPPFPASGFLFEYHAQNRITSFSHTTHAVNLHYAFLKDSVLHIKVLWIHKNDFADSLRFSCFFSLVNSFRLNVKHSINLWSEIVELNLMVIIRGVHFRNH